MSAWSAAHAEHGAAVRPSRTRAEVTPRADAVASYRRRALLKRGGLLAVLVGCGLLGAREALAAGEDRAFDATTLREVLAGLGGEPATAAQIALSVDDMVENGAIVPVSVECSLPDVRDIFLIVEDNPTPLAVRFRIPEGTEPFVATRLKLAQSSRVHAVARSQGKLYAAVRETKVTVGACS